MKAAETRQRGSCGAGAGAGELLQIMSVMPGAGSILHDSSERSRSWRARCVPARFASCRGAGPRCPHFWPVVCSAGPWLEGA